MTISTQDSKGGNSFDTLWGACITESMRDLLGQSGADSMAYHLHLEKVGSDAAALHRGLTSMLGEPAKVIETVIIKSLYNQLGLPFSESGNFDFVRNATEARAIAAAPRAGGTGQR